MKAFKNNIKENKVRCYKDNNEHLSDELRKLDLLLRLRVLIFRQKLTALQEDLPVTSMYISHAEADRLLHHEKVIIEETVEIKEIRRHLSDLHSEIGTRVNNSLVNGVYLALPNLAHIFGLSPFEIEVIMVCIASELYRKYDKIYAYLQDDIARKKPSIDLILDLLCNSENERREARTYFHDKAPLFYAGLLQMIDDPQSPSGSTDLARFLKIDPRIFNFILSNNDIDGRIINIAKLLSPTIPMENVIADEVVKQRFSNFIRRKISLSRSARKKLIIYLYGPYGVGKRDIALGICGQLNSLLLYIDIEMLLSTDRDAEKMIRVAFRESALQKASVYLDNFDAMLKDDAGIRILLKTFIKIMAEYNWLIFLSGEKNWSPNGLFEYSVFHSFNVPVPDVPLRKIAWEKELEKINGKVSAESISLLSSRFRFTPGQIRDAVAFAENLGSMKDDGQQITMADLFIASRYQSNQKLGELAVKSEAQYSWDDLVLPDEKVKQLKEMSSQVRNHYRVFGEWGFDRKLSYGKGLSVLFSGAPGTGKTMAAQVIANELQLDIYKIDLSGVVSKYIGETEKNLAKIFEEAETSNAILFFDEADALFGKRTEVSDAHDRYANIETSYLLQRMEEYEGVVILATNLRENIDDAFTRRIRFIVEFPFPDEKSRLRIWKNHFPKQAPMQEGIDYEFLSKQFQIAGGCIRNIVINSAFLAAEDGGIISMEHILAGTKREFEKIGKLWSEIDYINNIKHVRRI